MDPSAQNPKSYTLWIRDKTSGRTHEVLVRRKNVKNLNLRISDTGSVTLGTPHQTTQKHAQAFLDRKAAWVFTCLDRQRSRQKSIPPGMVPLWGELIAFSEDENRVKELYAREVAAALPAIAQRYQQAMNQSDVTWQVRWMKSRWGSCTPARRSIRINARLAAYPRPCLEFVVAHELVHLMEPSHNQRFHMLLDCYCPSNRQLARLLARRPLDGH